MPRLIGPLAFADLARQARPRCFRQPASQSRTSSAQPRRAIAAECAIVAQLPFGTEKFQDTLVMQQTFDRTAEDLGNAIHLEHVNVTIPDQRLATLFYVTGLGLTRDPYLMVSDSNMWVNAGRSQFHLPAGKAQVL